MKFSEYQELTAETAVYPGQGGVLGIYYTSLGLGEVGEVQGKVKKILRDKDGIVDDAARLAISKELGDVLWYVSQLATELDLDLDDVADGNIAKLFDRRNRGVIAGDGDDR